MRLRGHALTADGAALNADGRHTQVVGYGRPRTSGTGYARCACGAMSPDPLPSLAARRAWHRNHKENLPC